MAFDAPATAPARVHDPAAVILTRGCILENAEVPFGLEVAAETRVRHLAVGG